MPPVPNVAMNALRRALVTSKPLINPPIAPTSRAITMTRGIGSPDLTKSPTVRKTDNVAIAPTLRSN